MKTSLLTLTTILGLAGITLAASEPVREPAHFTTEDGVEILGDFYPPAAAGRAPAVILLHIYRSDRTSWRPLIPKLHEAGFAVLALDMRGHGESVQPATMRLR
ncbi:MAG: alpha/beta fold hydrolase, partial [Planctomycetota bacterium]